MLNSAVTLSGLWKIEKDNPSLSVSEQSLRIPAGAKDVDVAGTFAQNRSMWHMSYARIFPQYHGYVWYYRAFTAEALSAGSRALLKFDSAGYVAQVYVNGSFRIDHRHSEQPFTCDITDVIREGENLIAVRCFEPCHHQPAIDGVKLDEIPNGSWAYGDYDRECVGGIMGEVKLEIVPELYLDDIYVKPDFKTGHVTVDYTAVNCGAEKTLSLFASCTERKWDRPCVTVSGTESFPAGESSHTLDFTVPAFKLWDIDCPVTYALHLELANGAALRVNFGFKDLHIENGFFILNGRRIFLKCAHYGQNVEQTIGMKTAGFNAVRMLTRLADREILDVCDDIGLLVIDTSLTSWGMCDHANTRQQVFDYMDNVVHLHRNHVSIGAFYLLNELSAVDNITRKESYGFSSIGVFKACVDYLPRLRELDREHIVLLSSGRWDGDLSVGSLSNAFSDAWDCEWGADGDVNYPHHAALTKAAGGWAENVGGMGDIHPYMKIPMDRETRDWFRFRGSDTRPVFISETGIGSQSDPVRWLLDNQFYGIPKDDILVRQNTYMVNGLNDFIESNGFEDIFPFPQDFCLETFRLNARQRQQVFDVIRSNPMCCGYSLTSWGRFNESTLEEGPILKEGQHYALQEGWAPLRWALFTSERTVYADTPFEVEAVLCNEDKLKPGTYPAEARIHGANGNVWKHPFDAVYPEKGYGNRPPLAASVLKETVSLPAGDYTLTVRFKRDAAPMGGILPLKVVRVDDSAAQGKRIAVWGLEEKTLSFLHAHNVSTCDFSEDFSAERLLLVGNPADLESGWQKAMDFAQRGGHVLFLRTDPFRTGWDGQNRYLHEIAGENALCVYFQNWLYHMDTVHIESPLFANTTPAGICDLETWGIVYPDDLILHTEQPDRVEAAALGLNCFIEKNCASSRTFFSYRRGKGTVTLNGFLIEQSLGHHPFADQLLLNIAAMG